MSAKIILSDLVREFLDRDLAEETRRTYDLDLALFRDFAGNRPIKEFTPHDIDLYTRHLREQVSARTGQPLAKATVQKRLKAIDALFNLAVRRGYLRHSPAVHLKFRRLANLTHKKAIPEILLRQTFAHVGEHARAPERETLILTALAVYGLRRSDLARLRIEDVDLSAGRVLLHRKAGRVHELPVMDDFADAYRRWMAVRPETEHTFVLTSFEDAVHPPMTAPAISQTFRRLVKAVTGKSYGPHSVRHLWALNAMKTGMALTAQQEVLGHSDARYLWENYGKVDNEDVREALEERPLLALRGERQEPKPPLAPAPVIIITGEETQGEAAEVVVSGPVWESTIVTGF